MQEKTELPSILIAQTGKGKGRNIDLILKNLPCKNGKNTSIRNIAKMAGVSRVLVKDTMLGIKNNQKVLTTLENLGVPSTILFPSVEGK